MPFRRPAEGVFADGLPDAPALMVGPFRELEAADEVGQVMRQVSIFRRVGVLLESVLVRERERFGRWNVVERSLDLPPGGREGVNASGLKVQNQGPAAGRQVGLTDKLRAFVAEPDAEFVSGKSFGNLDADGLWRFRILGFHDDAVIARCRIAEHAHGTAAIQFRARVIDILPAEARKLAIVRIAPQGLPYDIMTAPRLMGQDHRRILTVRLQRIDGADVIPVDDLRGPADDIVLIEALDNGDQAVEAFPVDMLFTVPERFAECLDCLALLL